MSGEDNPLPFKDIQRYQPLNVFFDLKLGGLERIFDYPNIPVSMHYHMDNFACAGGSLEITLFDEAAAEVEPYIWDARVPPSEMPRGEIRWGYNGRIDFASEFIPFSIDSYTPVWRDNAFSIIIYATIYPEAHGSSYQYSGTVREFIADWAKNHSMDKVEFIPKLGLNHMKSIGDTDRDSTTPHEMLVYKLQADSDWQALQKVCQSCRDQQGRVGYYPRIKIEQGKKVLQIIRPNSEMPVIGTFVVQEQDSVVIDWSPHIELIPMSGREEHYNGRQFSTGHPMKVPMDKRVVTQGQNPLQDTFGQHQDFKVTSVPQHDPPERRFYVCPEDFDDHVTKGAIRARPRGTSNTLGGLNKTFSEFVSNHWSLIGMEAELTVMGDHRIEPGRLVEVVFYNPLNFFNKGPQQQRHYTSGIYWINEVEHHVELGSYTTTMHVWRVNLGHEEPQKGKKH